MTSITDLTAGELSGEVTAGRLDPVRVAEAYLTRLDEVNPALNAVVQQDTGRTLDEARRVTKRLAEGEQMPLAGVPFTVKDNIWVAGMPLRQGSRLFDGFVAPADAVAVTRLRRAGAVFLGITNCSEFACKGVTTNLVYGETRNPWDTGRTPGGSSGGAASAVAAGLCPLALGTDAGGSVRRPAAHTGVVGFKASSGLIPHPVGFAEPVFGNSVIGIMTRSVADARLALTVMAGPDERDPQWVPLPGDLTRPGQSGSALARLRVAYSPQLGLDFSVDADVAACVESAVAHLQAAGLSVARHDPAWPKGTNEAALMPLQFAGLASIHGDAFAREPQRFDPDIAAQIEQGLALSGRQVADALLLREGMYRDLMTVFEDFDLLVTPTTPVTAWPLGQLGPSRIGNRAASSRGHAVFTPLFNHTYLPACSVPCGLADGLPVGLQIVGPRYSDSRVLAAAAAIEAAMNGRFRNPVSPKRSN
jgi:aspartyl-tRNA(Asn)/glutamyl-tRNA(Gln) amidotransferase subunit A